MRARDASRSSARRATSRWTTAGRAGCSTSTGCRSRDHREGSRRRLAQREVRCDRDPGSVAAAAGPRDRRCGLGGVRRVRRRRRKRAGVQRRVALFADRRMKLPVKNVLEGVKNTDFYAPGSIFGVEVNKASPLAAGLNDAGAGSLVRGQAGVRDHGPCRGDRGALVSRRAGMHLLSGWLLGATEAERQGRDGRREARARARGAVRIPPAVSGSEQRDVPADLGGDRRNRRHSRDSGFASRHHLAGVGGNYDWADELQKQPDTTLN